MEEIDELSCPQPVERKEDFPGESLWRQSATGAVALTLLASCGIAINVHNSVEALGNILFTVPVTFFFCWVICTFLLWLWQVIFGKRE
jgi:hypothetical protein